MMMVQFENHHKRTRLEELKRLIDDEDYLNGAVRRLAQVLSDELIGSPKAGARHERKRQGRQ